jgi:hypothetical protein
VVALVAVMGCHAEIQNNGIEIDASGSGGSDSGTSSDAPNLLPDAGPACSSGRVVYLNFEGATLTQGASDATTNHAVWMGTAGATATVPPFKAGVVDRLQQITDVTNLVRAAFAAYPITVVTQRPAVGPYVMVGFGGTRQQVNVPYLYAVNRLDCGDAVKSDVAWIFDAVPSTQKTADYAIGAVAFGLGLTGTNDVNDCMCGWLTQCQQTTTACTFSTSITAVLQCPNQTNPQNEVAALQAFCQ